jgi:DNA processing protein
VAGALELLAHHRVAIVGSRNASPAGRARARDIAKALALAGIVVVSGLAEGIDVAAHQGAMAAPAGRTIAVVGTPLDRAYPPQHARLQEAIYREHLLVSPFAPGTRTHRAHFPARNRLMARLSEATVLVEAGDRSGTIHEVRESLRLKHPVYVAEYLANEVAWLRELRGDGRVVTWAEATEAVALCCELARGAICRGVGGACGR